MRWTVAGPTDECGYDGKLIGAGEPMQLVGPTARPLKRCVNHMHGAVVDWDAVDAARHAIEAEAERRAMSAEHQPVPVRLPLTRRPAPPRPFVKLDEIGGDLFDPKALAAGRDD